MMCNNKTQRGRLIVIESLGDNYGKTTIVRHLEKSLPKSISLSFPNDNSHLGHAIRMHLSEKVKPLTELSPLIVSSMFLTEMAVTFEQKIYNLLDLGYDVILDRYYLSTAIYETAINEIQISNKTKKRYVELNSDLFLHELQTQISDIYNLPVPTLTVVLTDNFGVCDTDTKTVNEFDKNKDLQKLTKEIGRRILDSNNKLINVGEILELNISSTNKVRYTVEHNISKVLEKLDNIVERE